MVDNDVLGVLEPETRNLIQNPSFFWNRVRHDHVKGTDAICGDNEKLLPKVVDIPHFSPSLECQVTKIRFSYNRSHRRSSLITKWAQDFGVPGVSSCD